MKTQRSKTLTNSFCQCPVTVVSYIQNWWTSVVKSYSFLSFSLYFLTQSLANIIKWFIKYANWRELTHASIPIIRADNHFFFVHSVRSMSVNGEGKTYLPYLIFTVANVKCHIRWWRKWWKRQDPLVTTLPKPDIINVNLFTNISFFRHNIILWLK